MGTYAPSVKNEIQILKYTDILSNDRTSAELTMKEERISKEAARLLWDSGTISRLEIGTYLGLKQIHEFLFQDVFFHAGRLRTVNLSKGYFRFAGLLYLEEALRNIDRMPHETYEGQDSFSLSTDEKK